MKPVEVQPNSDSEPLTSDSSSRKGSGPKRVRRRERGGIIGSSKHRRLLYLSTYGTWMTKTLSKSKSSCGSKHERVRRKGDTHVTKEGFVRTLAKQRKRYWNTMQSTIVV